MRSTRDTGHGAAEAARAVRPVQVVEADLDPVGGEVTGLRAPPPRAPGAPGGPPGPAPETPRPGSIKKKTTPP
ncbi:hypothetical protein ACFWEG_08960, partial [Streptomyces sp. NPDC060194]